MKKELESTAYYVARMAFFFFFPERRKFLFHGDFLHIKISCTHTNGLK